MTFFVPSSSANPVIYKPQGWDAAWRAALANVGSQCVPVLGIGDSIMRGANATNRQSASWWQLLMTALLARYPSAGSGFHYITDTEDLSGTGTASTFTGQSIPGGQFNGSGATVDGLFGCWAFTAGSTDWKTSDLPYGIGGQAVDSDNGSSGKALATVLASDGVLELYYNRAVATLSGGAFTVAVDGQAYDKTGTQGGGAGNLSSAIGTGATFGASQIFPGSSTLPNTNSFTGTIAAVSSTGSHSVAVTATGGSSLGSLTAGTPPTYLIVDPGVAGKQEVVALTAWSSPNATATFANTHSAGAVVQTVHQMLLSASPGRIHLVGVMGYNSATPHGLLPIRIARSGRGTQDFVQNWPSGAPDPVQATFLPGSVSGALTSGWGLAGKPPALLIFEHGVNDMQNQTAYETYLRNTARYCDQAVKTGASIVFLIPLMGGVSTWTNAGYAAFYIDRILHLARKYGALCINVDAAWNQIVQADPSTASGHGGYTVMGDTSGNNGYTTVGKAGAVNTDSHPTTAGHAAIATLLTPYIV